jgi:DNA-binding protein HU-beta
MTKKGRFAGARKQELVDSVAEKAGITKENAKMAIKSVQDSLLDLLEQSGRIQLAKFGIFAMKKTAARMGRNPATGQPIKIPAGYRIGFKVSKTWKDSMMLRKRAQEEKAAKPAVNDARATRPAAKSKAKPAARKNWKKR